MSTRERILDAAFDLTCARGWHKVTMSDLAAQSQVSRQSVYNEFGTREGVATALVQREVARFMTVVDATLGAGGPACEAIGRTAEAVFSMADDNPLLRSVLTGDDSSLIPLLNSTAVIDVATAHVHAQMPQLDDLAVDAVVRVVVSHIMQPSTRRPDIAEVAQRLLRLG